MDALIGRTIGGRFLITGRIARGGMACVYAATQAQLNRAVAIKVMRSRDASGDTSSEEFARRFSREASILSRLQHPNLVTLLDYGRITELADEHYFIAMEYLNGETLARRFRTRGRLSLAESIRIARQIGRGLREAHRQGIIHRDLKPSNIMLVPEEAEDDLVKLIDFGIGKVLEPGAHGFPAGDDEEMTRVGLLLGSPRYMAPEQIRGEAVEARTDLYALGIILFQALTGRVPFQGKSEMDTLVAQCTLPAPPLDAYSDEAMPDSLSDLVAELLKKHPSDRPTIHEFLQRLANVERELFDSVGLAGHTLSDSRMSFAPRVLSPPPWGLEGQSPGSASRLVSHARGVQQPRSDPPRADSTLSSPRSQSIFDLTNATAPLNPPAQLVGQAAAAPMLAPPPVPVAGNTWVDPAPKRKLAAWWILAVLAPLLWLALRGDPPTADRADASARPSAVAPAPTPAPTSFVLRLDSAPSGAVVSEGGITLGRTPLELTIARPTVASSPRRFALEHDGYTLHTFEQADSQVDVAAVARLSAASKGADDATAAPRGRGARGAADAAAAAREPQAPAKAPEPRPAGQGLDINMYR